FRCQLATNIASRILEQSQPSLKRPNYLRIMQSFEKAKLPKNNAVIEFRDSSWWKQVRAIAKIGLVFCSVNAPGLPNDIITTNNTNYLRLHGSKEWYDYVYSKRDLDNIL